MGSTFSGSLGWPVAFIVLMAIAIVIVLVLRSQIRKGAWRQDERSGHRLSVVETLDIDAQRRLAIVRCDGMEHLILLGTNGDIVVKADVAEAKAAMTAPEREIARAPEPVLSEAPPVVAPVTRPAPVPEPAPEPTLREPIMPEPPKAPEPVLRTPPVFAPRPVEPTGPIAVEPAMEQPKPEPVVEPAPVVASILPEPVVAPPPSRLPPAPEFSEMTRKLEEALKRTAAQRISPVTPRPVEGPSEPRPAEQAPITRQEPRLDDLLAHMGQRAPASEKPAPENEALASAPVLRAPPPFTTADFTRVSVSTEPLIGGVPPEPEIASEPPLEASPAMAPSEPAQASSVSEQLSVPEEVAMAEAAPTQDEPQPAPEAAPVEATNPQRPSDPFEEEIRRLLGRGRDTTA